MVRRITFLLMLIATLAAGHSLALGLGEITLHSALNQKFNAEIELLEADGLGSNEILTALASSEDFDRVGVERFFFLTDLKFVVETKANGRQVLRITSRQPVTEPYLNFLVEIRWPSGRLLREYTVLLDPPTFTNKQAPAIAAPSRSDPGGGGAGRVNRTPTPRPDSQVSLSNSPKVTSPASSSPSSSPTTGQSSANQPALGKVSGGNYGVTDRNDTLWTIAAANRASSAVSVQQNMLALQRLNPEAFIKGNINLLKAGFVLRLPTEAEALSLSSTEAIAEVAQHNQAWQAYRNGEALADQTGAPANADTSNVNAQLDSSDTPRTGSASNTTGEEGELRIVAAEDGTAASSSAGSGDDQAFSTQLAASREEQERLLREKDEVVYQLDRLMAQEEQTKRQLEVKDQQVAQLQQQLQAAQQQLAASSRNADSAGSSPSEAGTAGTPGDVMALLKSPFVLGGGALVIVAGLALMLISARRRKAELDDELAYVHTEAVEPSLGAAAEYEETVEDEYSDDQFPEESASEGEEITDETSAEEGENLPEEEHTHAAQTTDVIGEADIYIAYNRYPQAVALLLGALDEAPDRSEVRLKLLEVYAETQDHEGFEKHLAELVAHCEDDEILLHARELEAQLNGEEDLDLTSSSVATSDSVGSQGTVDEFELSLDEEPSLDLDSVLGKDDDLGPEAESDHGLEEEFTLELDDEPVASAATDIAAEESKGSDDLGGDLGMDFNPDSEATQIRQVEGSDAMDDHTEGSEDDDLSFDLDSLDIEEPAASVKEVAMATEEASATEEAFDFLDEQDTASTKLDLARAYIDMGDEDGARDILSEVMQEGSDDQQEKAGELLQKLG